MRVAGSQSGAGGSKAKPGQQHKAPAGQRWTRNEQGHSSRGVATAQWAGPQEPGVSEVTQAETAVPRWTAGLDRARTVQGAEGLRGALSPVLAVLDGRLAQAGPLQKWGVPASVCAGGEDAVLWGEGQSQSDTPRAGRGAKPGRREAGLTVEGVGVLFFLSRPGRGLAGTLAVLPALRPDSRSSSGRLFSALLLWVFLE